MNFVCGFDAHSALRLSMAERSTGKLSSSYTSLKCTMRRWHLLGAFLRRLVLWKAMRMKARMAPPIRHVGTSTSSDRASLAGGILSMRIGCAVNLSGVLGEKKSAVARRGRAVIPHNHDDCKWVSSFITDATDAKQRPTTSAAKIPTKTTVHHNRKHRELHEAGGAAPTCKKNHFTLTCVRERMRAVRSAAKCGDLLRFDPDRARSALARSAPARSAEENFRPPRGGRGQGVRQCLDRICRLGRPGRDAAPAGAGVRKPPSFGPTPKTQAASQPCGRSVWRGCLFFFCLTESRVLQQPRALFRLDVYF